jgi:hypothetical protein
MTPITFPQVNVVLRRPDTMSNERCGTLPIYRGETEEGYPVSISCFSLGDEEIAKIIKEKKIWLYLYAMIHPPVALSSVDPWESR